MIMHWLPCELFLSATIMEDDAADYMTDTVGLDSQCRNG